MKEYKLNPRKRIDNITSGGGLASDNFEGDKGTIAIDLWHDGKFILGMEYGYILAMQDLLSGRNSTAAKPQTG